MNSSPTPLPTGHTAVMASRREAPRRWLPVPSFPGYFANADGQILGRRGRVLKQTLRPDGYLQINLSVDGVISSRRVHTLVCEAFHGLRPSPLHVAAHGDGRRSNNAKDNLRWATGAENRDDMIAHGTRPNGETHPRATLTDAQAEEIRTRYAAARGESYVRRGFRAQLAREYGVPIHVIKDLVGGRTWKPGRREALTRPDDVARYAGALAIADAPAPLLTAAE